jgi:lysophospholipase L1-like esterase
MYRRRCVARSLVLALSFAVLGHTAFAKKKRDHWVGTWATSPVAAANADGKFGAVDTTYREIVRISLAGPLTRVVLSNEFGTEPLTIGAVHAALSAGHGDVALSSANALTFNGSPTITIPAGGTAASDPAALALTPFADVAVSIFVPAQTITTATLHSFANQTSYAVHGNLVGAASLTSPGTVQNAVTLPATGTAADPAAVAPPEKIYSWPFLKGVDVYVGPKFASAVMFGDSITDGALSTRDANARWPDLLAHRLHDNKATENLGVLNEGIGGNRVLHDGTGPRALDRFDRDVLNQAGVRYVVLMEGINDIGHAADPVKPYDVVSADDIIAGLKQMTARAHAKGIHVIGATLTPYAGAKYASPAGDTMRQAVNQWIRTAKDLDGVIDFEKATRDPANPAVFNPVADSGDHLHPKDAGYRMMADSIDLKLFTTNKKKQEETPEATLLKPPPAI